MKDLHILPEAYFWFSIAQAVLVVLSMFCMTAVRSFLMGIGTKKALVWAGSAICLVSAAVFADIYQIDKGKAILLSLFCAAAASGILVVMLLVAVGVPL